jgi:hypothetical protein
MKFKDSCLNPRGFAMQSADANLNFENQVVIWKTQEFGFVRLR